MNVIAVAGKTGANTSAVVRWMRLYPGVCVVSFGEFLRQQNTRGADLQDFGQHFVEKYGPAAIVEGTLEGKIDQQCASLIIDGLRHVKVWDVITNHFPKSTLLCVDPPDTVLIQSLTESGGIEAAEARKRIQHPVETGFKRLVDRADYVTRGNTIVESEEHAVRGLVALVDQEIIPEALQDRISSGTLSQHARRKRKTELLKSQAMSRGRRAVFRLLLQEGGCISQTEVGKRLRLPEKEIARLSSRGELLAVAAGGEPQFPVWQFSGDKILKGFELVLAALGDHNNLAKLRFFLAGNLHLSGRSPLEVLREGKAEETVRAARCYLSQGAA
jgi:hypothetical protein